MRLNVIIIRDKPRISMQCDTELYLLGTLYGHPRSARVVAAILTCQQIYLLTILPRLVYTKCQPDGCSSR